MPLSDTIVAIGTPRGRGRRGMLRLSGSGVREVLAGVLDGPPRPFERSIFASRVRLADRAGLPCLVVLYRAPASYTGEDMAELLLPGNPFLLDRLVEHLLRHGHVRRATPGEFSARAYLNDRLSLAQAEGVALMIAAQTTAELEAARELIAGRTGDRYRAWTDEVAMLLALVEAGIDFTDQEDVVAIAPAQLRSRLKRIADGMEQYLGAASGQAVRSELPRVVLAGLPNAGKSTLFNALLGRERSVVSEEAGTTRDAIEEELDLRGTLPGAAPVMLVDVAGVESAAGEIDRAAQDAATRAIEGADVVVHCDPAGRFEDLTARAPVIRVRTKADLPGAHAEGDVAVCALDRWNLPVLRRAIADLAAASRGSEADALLPRHRRALIVAIEGVRAARGSCADDQHQIREPELVAGALREALDALGELVGHISPDDVIGRIFATFCVGK